MCGISGLFCSNKKLEKADCINFIDAIAHRGPDGRGSYFDSDNNLFLGHRRLKILDLSEAGAQPMHSLNGRYVIVFNGEIYNFLELKEELIQKGYSFRSQSDTEVILAAFHEWGEGCQLKFNGMWAFAIWDTSNKTLFLSRDRFGVKPLYFYQKEGWFAFASEIKAFGALPFVSLEPSDQKVADTIEDPLCLEPTSETLFQDIQKLPAGCFLTLSQDGVRNIKRWWNTLSHLPNPPSSSEEQVQKFRELFFDACSVRMRSDVAIGTALSGGLDSSSILSSIFSLSQNSNARWPDSWQKSFTAVFPNSSHDELEYAKIASNHVKANSFFFPITSADLVKHLESALYSIEDVFDPPIGPWLLYREYRKQGVTISIDGHGADELLCGYHHQFERALLDSLFPYPKLSRTKNLWSLMKQMYSMNSDRKGTDLLLKLMKNGAQSLFQGSGFYQTL
ncbi:MAG TPA: asparagine synthase (glutamine-hydrolyzing), partial [Chlamydiales bacterium]